MKTPFKTLMFLVCRKLQLTPDTCIFKGPSVGWIPLSSEAGTGLATLATQLQATVNVSIFRLIAQLVTTCVPFVSVSDKKTPPSPLTCYPAGMFSTISNLSAKSTPCFHGRFSFPYLVPLLATLGVPYSFCTLSPSLGLFGDATRAQSNLNQGSSCSHSNAPHKWSHEYKRSVSASITIV